MLVLDIRTALQSFYKIQARKLIRLIYILHLFHIVNLAALEGLKSALSYLNNGLFRENFIPSTIFLNDIFI